MAETPLSQQLQGQAPKQTNQPEALGRTVTESANPKGKLSGAVSESKAVKTIPAAGKPFTVQPVSEGVHYVATAYSLRGKTASGRYVSQGIIAADPRVLPLGSRVRLEAGAWSGEYLVADTGGAIRGRKIDIWTPTTREAMRFGRRKVKLTVLSYPSKRATRKRVQT